MSAVHEQMNHHPFNPSRRGFLRLAAGAAATAALAGCGGFTGKTAASGDSDALSFTTWGTDAELAGLRQAISSFESSKQGSVTLNVVPYDQVFTDIDAQIQAGKAPDVFRVPYYTLGAYAGRGQLLDISSHLPSGFADRFTPQAWAAVQSNGHPVGVPHHTDTSVILYNKALVQQAGLDSFPTTLADAWTWEEFADVAAKLRSGLPDDKYPFVVNWQGNGVTRWLTWLFEGNGRFLSPDLKSAAIDSDAARAAVDFTRSFFAQKWVPANSSVKSTTLAQDTWFSQTAAMAFEGAFLLPDAQSTASFEWGATFAPRHSRAGSDFGGNAVVVTAGTKKAELAVSFLDHLTQRDQMQQFCASASLLPTRADLIQQGIDFDVRPDLSPVFVGQASTVQAADAGQVASPSMAKIITVLKDQLDSAFTGSPTTESVVAAMAQGIGQAVSG